MSTGNGRTDSIHHVISYFTDRYNTKIKDLDTNLYIIPIKCGSYDRYQPKGFSYFNGRLCSPVH